MYLFYLLVEVCVLSREVPCKGGTIVLSTCKCRYITGGYHNCKTKVSVIQMAL